MKIVSVERELNARIEDEKQKAKEWIESFKMELYGSREKIFLEMENELKEYEDTEKNSAEKKASEIIKKATERIEMIRDNINDDTLKSIILSQIKRILP